MDLEFTEYEPKKIINVHKHVDGPWFWEIHGASLHGLPQRVCVLL